jgi:hypothetical protein
MPDREFHRMEKQDLIDLLIITRNAIEKKNDQLKKTRVRLSSAKKRLRKMKDIIQYQRTRILGLPVDRKQ